MASSQIRSSSVLPFPNPQLAEIKIKKLKNTLDSMAESLKRGMAAPHNSIYQPLLPEQQLHYTQTLYRAYAYVGGAKGPLANFITPDTEKALLFVLLYAVDVTKNQAVTLTNLQKVFHDVSPHLALTPELLEDLGKANELLKQSLNNGYCGYREKRANEIYTFLQDTELKSENAPQSRPPTRV